MDNDSLDPDLLKRMMLGDFSASFSNKKEVAKTPNAKKKLEVDLHFEKLHPEKPHLSSSEKLELQLKACNEICKENLKKATNHHNWQFSKFAKSLLELINKN